MPSTSTTSPIGEAITARETLPTSRSWSSTNYEDYRSRDIGREESNRTPGVFKKEGKSLLASLETTINSGLETQEQRTPEE